MTNTRLGIYKILLRRGTIISELQKKKEKKNCTAKEENKIQNSKSLFIGSNLILLPKRLTTISLLSLSTPSYLVSSARLCIPGFRSSTDSIGTTETNQWVVCENPPTQWNKISCGVKGHMSQSGEKLTFASGILLQGCPRDIGFS